MKINDTKKEKKKKKKRKRKFLIFLQQMTKRKYSNKLKTSVIQSKSL